MKKLLFTALVFAAVFVMLELLARIAGTIDEDIAGSALASSEPWMIHSPAVGWERRPGYAGRVGLDDREFDAEGYLTVDSDEITGSLGKKKIVFVGDSNTSGWGAPTPASFVEVTENLLPDVDAINLGVAGYSSYQGRVVVERYLPILKPDLLVVSFNFNDRRYVLPPESMDGPEEFKRAYEASRSTMGRIARLVEISHFYRGLRRVMRKVGLVPKYVGEVDVTGLEPRVDEASYRSNLSRIAAERKTFEHSGALRSSAR